ncbi:acyl-CoA dehydrogenase family protein [Mycolicibacterium thermoresistibile]|uniref:Acyl-CoA dehydrogenase domain-containing protein n=2 Tax=Mycolicibacterium thermoresistibile TaxID=1797 RepID=G7CN23_MYCT3|nr:acyl-CoA dehydrogenase family protein [Mycolicibacterium thermoresistibile]EHI10512.1 acyl-CoA dehydrogenase domain-containing protein [Mycolicibacterium thermoresistibile ATCC 19527]MCV7189651.1 acyl-CoA dehydrogenase family protein [Mycolicibacterium thermoresistibile]GAT15436.1 acyl-CoA dehydrogenase domain-containing protein [Mycolicibacterium thermoresistibile]SNW17495.1 acyl-CoA dehydrogenase [Mycolicibacterium thermoresistibile]
MDLSLSGEQRQLVEAFMTLYGRMCGPERVRAAEPLGFDAELWRALVDTGAVEMAVGEADGGAGDLELALIAEQHGRAVAPAPLIETQVAAKVLARCGSDLLPAAVSGERMVTFAPRPARTGCATLVPAGAVADVAIVLHDDRLLAVPAGGMRQVANLGSMPLADIPIGADATTLAAGETARTVHADAVDRWLVLTALALVGIAARAVEMGADYAKQREAFGAPIGTFQGVAHPLADSATAVDGARLLGYRAACAVTDEPDRAAELAAMAFVFAYETARDATLRSLHIHGGYGFGMEHDIQLYYRRARGWAMVYAEPAAVLDRVADARYGPVPAR